jgi:histidinol phosphatase-like enzyme
MKILFLDLDGVVRVPTGKARLGEDDFDFCQERIGMLSEFVEQTGVKIVISSDWRLFETREGIERNLSRNLAGNFHDDWMTPILGKRWKEIETWLGTHPEATSFAVVDDFLPHFEDCANRISERLVLCDTRIGITNGTLIELGSILSSGGDKE